MATLALSGVNKKYPSGVTALYDINFTSQDGEFIAVVGGEKCGKSTLLRVIAGLEEADSGVIAIAGKDVSEVEIKDRDLAVIFNGNTLYPALNVFDNIAFGLRLRKFSYALIEQRVKIAAQMLGLTDVLNRKPKALTAAQKQKTMFARAIVREPQLYLLDDPLSGFDDALKGEMTNILINLQARMHGTFIYATKNLSDALRMATRLIVLKEGFVQQIDTPVNLYDYPANAYVAFYIGSPSINFIHGARIVREEKGVYAVFGEHKLPLTEQILARFTDKENYIDADKQVTIGIRPEDITQNGECVWQAVISEIDEVDDARFATCDIAEKLSLVARVDGEKGQTVCLAPDCNRLYLFDGETQLTLLARDEGYQKTPFADADYLPRSFVEEEGIKNANKPVGKKAKKK